MHFCNFKTPQKQKRQKQLYLINFDPLWACRDIVGHGRIILVQYGPWGTPWDPSSDNFCVPNCDEIFLTWPYEHLQG